MKTSVSLYLDQRRALSNGRFPLKVRVYDPRTRRTKYYLLNRSLTEQEFAEINSVKPKKPFRDLKIEISSLLAHYFEKVKAITPFSFQRLEQELNLSKIDNNDVPAFLDYMAKEDERKGKLKNAKLYTSAKNSFLKYQRTFPSSKSSKLSFLIIDREWLEGYEGFMVNVLGLSWSTVGVYLRQLRTAWNKLSQNNPELKELYPF